MGFILQLQRPAIEALYNSHHQKPQLPSNPTFVLNGKPAYFLGVSIGIGRNSEYKGMHVLVLGNDKPDKAREGVELIPVCSYIVLLREPSKKEFKKNPPAAQAAIEQTECVELLYVTKCHGKVVYLQKSNKIATYLRT